MEKFEIYKDASGSWRWRLKAANGSIVASSGESFSSKEAAQNGVDVVKRIAAGAAVQVIS